MKKTIGFILKHKKKIIIICCVCIIGISLYSDFILNKESTGDSLKDSYIYTSDTSLLSAEASPESAKILGEAKLVNGEADVMSEDAYFTSAQLNRQRSRDEALYTLQTVIDSSESMPDVKDEALAQMINIASDIETEAMVEEMIKAKGFSDCVAMINDGSISVVVKSPGLLTNEVAQITEIVVEETGFAPENIKIVEKK